MTPCRDDIRRVWPIRLNNGSWNALVCGDTCRMVESRATPSDESPLEPIAAIDILPMTTVRAISNPNYPSYDFAHPIVLGDGLYRLEKNGTWTELMDADQSRRYHSIGLSGPGYRLMIGGEGTIRSMTQHENIEIPLPGVTGTIRQLAMWSLLNYPDSLISVVTNQRILATIHVSPYAIGDVLGDPLICPFNVDVRWFGGSVYVTAGGVRRDFGYWPGNSPEAYRQCRQFPEVEEFLNIPCGMEFIPIARDSENTIWIAADDQQLIRCFDSPIP